MMGGMGRLTGLVAVIGSAALLAGCGGGNSGSSSGPAAAPQPSPPVEPKSTLKTRFKLTAIGLAIDEMRTGTNTFLDKTNQCVSLGQSGDTNGQLLCLRSAENAWKRSFLVAGNSVADALKRARGACGVQLGTVLKRIMAVLGPTVGALRAIAEGSETSQLSPLLDKLDRAQNRVDSAFARAQTLCGG